ncbi:hypothetical protein GRS66_006862 [Saccharomyces pastorianus]|uniref:Uncharacterized protein n=1 Tax=Saccharomyces pastorianus TaxID=27292 RepID=A0A6C1E5Z1_SACPS|nr:NTC20-like protein [Saccharomyces eubayanus]KOH00503.1 NTC20-like protein [Saccharomyces eubayanus]QID84361.1 hypothetical protein GRS66_006862 [Saccharomyces pastorianus]
MPSLRDLTIERNKSLSQLRARINKANKLSTTEFGAPFLKALDGTVNGHVLQPSPSSDSLSTIEQEISHIEMGEEDQHSHISLQRDQQTVRIGKVSETGDLKAKLASAMEELEKKTDETINSIIRKRLLQNSNYEHDTSTGPG